MPRKPNKRKEPPALTVTASLSHRERATPERLAKLAHGAVDITPASQEAPKGTQRISDPIDLLLRHGRITQREFNAGDQLRGDAYLAQIDPGPNAVNWDATGSRFGPRNPSMFSSQRIADARMRFRRVKVGVGGSVSPEIGDSVVWDFLWLGVVIGKDLAYLGREVIGIRRHEQREQHAAGMAGLRVALGALANWYEG